MALGCVKTSDSAGTVNVFGESRKSPVNHKGHQRKIKNLSQPDNKMLQIWPFHNREESRTATIEVITNNSHI